MVVGFGGDKIIIKEISKGTDAKKEGVPQSPIAIGPQIYAEADASNRCPTETAVRWLSDLRRGRRVETPVTGRWASTSTSTKAVEEVEYG